MVFRFHFGRLHIKLACTAFALLAGLATASSARAQLQYTNSVDAPVNETATPCTNPLIRNFNVTENFTVDDVDIGILINHTYRGDLLMWLVSPAGTRVQVFTGTGSFRNNFNVLLNDSAPNPVTGHNANDTAGAGTIVPPYQRNFRPANPLTPFNGENANGVWVLEICDRFNFDSGNFRQADLFLAAAPASVSTTKVSGIISDGISTGNPKAIPGALVRYCILITNGGPGIAENIDSNDMLPGNLSFVAGSIRSGTSCIDAATAEDDDNIGPDENDPVGASASGASINIFSPILEPGTDIAIIFDAVIN